MHMLLTNIKRGYREIKVVLGGFPHDSYDPAGMACLLKGLILPSTKSVELTDCHV